MMFPSVEFPVQPVWIDFTALFFADSMPEKYGQNGVNKVDS
jgi:hypothetical protein